jgi:hypothetical protein
MTTAYADTNVWIKYDRRFAYLPVRCTDNQWYWFTTYYKKYLVFSYEEIDDVMYFQGCMTKADAITEKLVEGF